MSVYAELLAAVTTFDFRAQAEDEHESIYLRRLMLAASQLPDREWSCLSAEAVEWVNISAERVNRHLPLESCPGFGDATRSYIGEDGTLWTPVNGDTSTFGTSIDVEEQEVSSEVPAENIVLDTHVSDSRDADDLHGEMPAAGYPKADGVVIEPVVERYESPHQGKILGNFISLTGNPPDPNCKIIDVTLDAMFPGKTDRIRALVMQHPDWDFERMKGVVGTEVSNSTLVTVRSVTLATIAVAKRLGKWVG